MSDRSPVAVEHPPDLPEPPPPTFVVPEGWVIDEVARERLQRQLVRSPMGIAGVVAEGGELPPGASFRVHAERMACAPLAVATERRSGPARGVVLLRPDVAFEVRVDTVDVGGAELLVDPGTHAHDPWQPSGTILLASPSGRPPFPCRPIVVFLATEPDDEAADWARVLVNGLVRNDVEGRLAMPVVAPGLHLTRPCLPEAESLDTLAPDVVVALDPAAGEMAAASRANRSLVVIESLSDIAATSELVSWRRGHTTGRVRARIGRRIDAGALAGLVRRLCAGPHPLAPAEQVEGPVRTWTPGIERRGPRWSPGEPRTLAVITGEKSASARIDGLVEHLADRGVTVNVVPLGRRAEEIARGADLIVLDTTARSEAAAELLRSCSGDAPRTVLDLGYHDLADDGSRVAPTLTSEAARLVTAADAITASTPALHAAARTFGKRGQLLPTLLPRASVSELRRMRSRYDRWTKPVVAWSLGRVRSATVVDAVGTSLLEILDELPDARVEVMGDRERVPPGLLAHARVTMVADRDAERLAAWIVHVWTPSSVGDEIADDLLPFVEASCAAVPTLVSARLRPSIEGYLSRDLLIDDEHAPSSWTQRLQPLVHDRYRWDRRSGEAAQRADALYGPVASELVASRFLGWARFEGS